MSGQLTHNAKSPWPVSYDGKKAQRCDKSGRNSVRGRYIKWEIQDQGQVIVQIAKLVKPKQIIQPIDLDVVKKAVETDPKYNTRLPRAKARIRTRLNKIYGKMGINYIDARNITSVTTKVETACWGTGPKPEDEFILCNPYFFLQRQKWAEFLLRHEVMHRAIYRGRKHLANKKLRNVVFDICINRILSVNPNGKQNQSWLEFCQWVYPEESRKTVLALCNASITPEELSYLRNQVNPVYADIWEELYTVEPKQIIMATNPRNGRLMRQKVGGGFLNKITSMNPDDLYFRLKKELNQDDEEALSGFGQDAGLNPFGDNDEDTITLPDGTVIILRDEANDIAGEASKRVEAAVRKHLVPKRFRGINWSSYQDHRTQWWDNWVKKPEDIYDPDLDKYAKRISTEKIMESVAGRITQSYEDEIKQLPYPEHLTEEGTMLALLGMRPPKWPFLQNLEGHNGRRRLIVFFDISPSMERFFSYVCFMCDTFEEHMDIIFAANEQGDPGVMSFAERVETLSHEQVNDMRQGKFRSGNGTSFDAVVEYCNEQISTNDVDAVVMFTDGESGLSASNARKFNATGKRMYRIYFLEDLKHNRGRKIETDLDRLSGESFTLCVPPTDVLDNAKT